MHYKIGRMESKGWDKDQSEVLHIAACGVEESSEKNMSEDGSDVSCQGCEKVVKMLNTFRDRR